MNSTPRVMAVEKPTLSQTLTPLVDHPSKARLSGEIRETIERLSNWARRKETAIYEAIGPASDHGAEAGLGKAARRAVSRESWQRMEESGGGKDFKITTHLPAKAKSQLINAFTVIRAV